MFFPTLVKHLGLFEALPILSKKILYLCYVIHLKIIPSSGVPQKIHLKFGTSYQGITNNPMYLFKALKYFNCFMFRELQPLSQSNMDQFLFAFVSISLKFAFKNTSAKKVDFG